MVKKFWRPVSIGDSWYIALLPEGASINTPITRGIKKKRIGRITGKGVNNYDKAWELANNRNRKIDPNWVDQ